MRALLFLLPALVLAANPPPPAPFALRTLALGHDPERKFRLKSDGFYEMLELEPGELPPTGLRVRPARAPSSAPLPGAPREPGRVPIPFLLNSVQQIVLPPDFPPEVPLAIDLEIQVPAAAGKPASKSYEPIAEIPRPAAATSALLVLYNPVGRKTWDGIKPTLLNTSESVLPPGGLLAINLTGLPLQADIGGRAGVLSPGQNALVRPSVASGLFSLRLALGSRDEEIQLVDSSRELPAGSRALLVVYPVPVRQNARGADFIFFPIAPDPKPEPAVVPPPGAAAAR
jgi:hypothetical protein